MKTLSSLGKLPEDAINLIKENSNVLASIDASDSESAYESLFRKFVNAIKKTLMQRLEIIANLKNTHGNTVLARSTSANQSANNSEQNNSSLECREQLGAQSPGPHPRNGFKFNPGVPNALQANLNKTFPAVPVGIKRKNDR